MYQRGLRLMITDDFISQARGNATPLSIVTSDLPDLLVPGLQRYALLCLTHCTVIMCRRAPGFTHLGILINYRARLPIAGRMFNIC